MNKVHVLLIEDNLSDLKLTSRVLNQFNIDCELHSVRDGVEALQFLYQKPPYQKAPRPDLILLDLNLPRMDGHELLVNIKKNDLADIPVVVLSTTTSARDRGRCLELGAKACFIKPMSYEQLAEVIRQAFESCGFVLNSARASEG